MNPQVELVKPTPQISLLRPLIPLQAAMILLDRDEDDVLAMIHSGILAWAWNIAGKSVRRQDVRIWRDSIIFFLNHQPQPEAEEELVIASFLPTGAEIRSPELQSLLSCSQGHVRDLIRRRLLAARRKSRATTGRQSYFNIRRQDVIAFFRARRIQSSLPNARIRLQIPVRRLRLEALSIGDFAQRMGVSVGTVLNAMLRKGGKQ